MSLDNFILKVQHDGSSSSVRYNEVKVFSDLRARLSQKMPRCRFRLHGADLYFRDNDLISRAVYLGAAFRDQKTREGVQEFILEDPLEAGGVLARKNCRPNPVKRVWKAGFLDLCVKSGDISKGHRRKEKKGKWNQFYFVYCGVSLFWFKDAGAYQMGRQAVGCLPMGGLVPDLTHHIVDERPNAFVLKVPSNWGIMHSGQTLYLDCGGAQTKAEWVSAFIDGRIRRKLCTMAQILPHIVAKFPKSEGLFRKAGQSEEIRHYMDQIDQCVYPDYASISREHDLTGVMKRNLRNMTEPLLTQAKYADFVSMGRIQDEKRRVDQLREAIRGLPTMNRVFARELFEGLNEVTKYSDVSKMSSSNLAIVIGPNILRKEGMDPMRVVSDNNSIVDIVTTMIDYWEQVFPNQVESEQLVSRSRFNSVSLTSKHGNILGSGLSSTSNYSNSKPKVSAGPSFADRFRRRPQGLYGMPSKGTMPSFISGPPSLPSGPAPPQPPPNMKAISQPRPSFRNSNPPSLRPSISGQAPDSGLSGNTLQLPLIGRTGSDNVPIDIENETGLLFTESLPSPIMTETKSSDCFLGRSPTSNSRQKARTNDRKSARKRKAKRGLPKRSGLPSTKSVEKSVSPQSTSRIRNITSAINENNSDKSQDRCTESKILSPPHFKMPVSSIASPEKLKRPPQFVEKKVTGHKPPPPEILKRPPSLTATSNFPASSVARKAGPPPVPSRKGRAQTVNSKPTTQSRRPPKAPTDVPNTTSLATGNSQEGIKSFRADFKSSKNQRKSINSNKNKLMVVPGPPPLISPNTGSPFASNISLRSHVGDDDSVVKFPPPSPGVVVHRQPEAVKDGPPPRPFAGGPPPGPTCNSPGSPPDFVANGPGTLSVVGSPPNHVVLGPPSAPAALTGKWGDDIPSRLDSDISDEKSAGSIVQEKTENSAAEEDDAIVRRCDHVAEICRAQQKVQEDSLNQLLENLGALNDINGEFQGMLERTRIPRKPIAKDLQSLLKILEEKRLQYQDAMTRVTEFLSDTLNSDDIICPSFLGDEEPDIPEEYNHGEEDTVQVYAKFPYQGGHRQDVDELVFEGGEIIEMLESNSDWSRGRIYNTEEEGWFPTSYVEELPESYFQEEEEEEG